MRQVEVVARSGVVSWATILAPSGGPYEADGAATFNPDSSDGSLLDTCTLPAAPQAVCDLDVTEFPADYGNQ
jgi:hypothetical protein